MKNIPEKSSIFEQVLSHLEKAYLSLGVSDSSKKMRKLLHRSGKKIASDVHSLLVDEFKKKEKEARKALKKEQKKNKKVIKKQKDEDRKAQKKQLPAPLNKLAAVKKVR